MSELNARPETIVPISSYSTWYDPQFQSGSKRVPWHTDATIYLPPGKKVSSFLIPFKLSKHSESGVLGDPPSVGAFVSSSHTMKEAGILQSPLIHSASKRHKPSIQLTYAQDRRTTLCTGTRKPPSRRVHKAQPGTAGPSESEIVGGLVLIGRGNDKPEFWLKPYKRSYAGTKQSFPAPYSGIDHHGAITVDMYVQVTSVEGSLAKNAFHHVHSMYEYGFCIVRPPPAIEIANTPDSSSTQMSSPDLTSILRTCTTLLDTDDRQDEDR